MYSIKYERWLGLDGEYGSYLFDYEIEDDDLEKAVVGIVLNNYYDNILEKYPHLREELYQSVKYTILEACQKEKISECKELLDWYKDDIKEIFQEEALASEYND